MKWTATMFRKSHPPAGARPGTLVAPAETEPPLMTARCYDERQLEVCSPTTAEEAAALRSNQRLLWLDVQGLGDSELIGKLGTAFAIHPLALEDAVNVPQNPTNQCFDEQQLVVVQTLDPGSSRGFSQLSLFIGKDYVLTIHERPSGVLDPVARRLESPEGRMRTLGPGYLAYAIIDAVIDRYYPLLEELGDQLEDLEERILGNPSNRALAELHHRRKELLALRRVLWPLRDAVNDLIRDPSPFVSDPVRLYFRDCHDHVQQMIEVVETYREVASGLLSTYLSAIGQRTNEVMKVLTVMSSVFIPLTFLVGVYGMNFDYMPELAVRWAYPALLAFMLLVTVGMLAYFYRLGWLRRRERFDADARDSSDDSEPRSGSGDRDRSP